MVRVRKNHAAVLAALWVLSSLMVGCAAPDRRVSRDRESCEALGHAQGTASFRECTEDLNDRRCSRGGPKSVAAHVETTDCTRLN